MRIVLCTVAVLMLPAVAALAKPGPLSVTISAQPDVVVYGSTTTLSGAVSTQQSDVKVTVLSQPCGTSSAKPMTSVTTTAQGSWSTTAGPTLRTVYQAKAKNATSGPVTVQVRPRMTLVKVAPHRFRTRVLAAQSFAGRIARFQRRLPFGGWRTLRTVVLRQVATGSSPTIVSGKTFRSAIRRHRTVRIILGRRQVGNCYLTAISNTVRS